MSRLDRAIAALPSDMDPFEHARARAMLNAYVGFWDAEDCEVLAVEREFFADLTRPDGTVDPDWLLGGKIDLALRWRGRVRLFDHKTSSEDVSPGSTFRGRLTLNSQASQYMIGGRAIGIDAEDFVFDVLGKPGIDPAKATPAEKRQYVIREGQTAAAKAIVAALHPDSKWGDLPQLDKATLAIANPTVFRLHADHRERDEYPAEFFARCCEKIAENLDRYIAQIDITRTEDELAEYMRTLYVDSTLIDTVREFGLVSRNEGSCFQFGGRPCDYHPVCSATASIDDATKYVRRGAHEELVHAPPPGKRLLTVSRRASFNSCRQRHDYRYERGIAAVERADVLAFGTAVHTAVEAYWLARTPESVRRAA